jgi:LPS-assembly protein
VADSLAGQTDVETIAIGKVELRKAGDTVNADRLVYRQTEEITEATGSVRLRRDEDNIAGPHLYLKNAEKQGYFEQPEYSIKRLPPVPKAKSGMVQALKPAAREPIMGSGAASWLDFEGEGLYRLKKATYSTCEPDRRDWYVLADELALDYNTEIGKATSSKVYFKDMPILYWPWMTFPLNNKRKSGLLAPTYGSSSTSGLELTLPWYWNIAENMDATIAPRVMTKRGIQLNTEFRYLEPSFKGQTRLEYLPNDRLKSDSRYAYAVLHDHKFAPGLTGNLNLNGVSDDQYFDDLSSKVHMVSQANLLRQGSVSYGAGWWNASAMVQSFQTLQDPKAPIGKPYYRVPQLTASAVRPDLPAGLAFAFSGEYVRFEHPTLVTGQRLALYPQLSLPIQTASLFVTPKLGLHSTRYNLQDQAPGVPDRLTRNVPIFSIDSGLVFERDVNWLSRSLVQTLEPRLYYLNVPARDQSEFPVFDSALMDFNFAQIFGENRYGGNDRVGDANQLTSALLSRLIDPESGGELMRGAIGQRFYFRDQAVTLPGETPRTSRRTDFLAAFSGRVAPGVYVDTGWQYDPNFNRTERFNVGGRYQPEPWKVLNANYRYTRDQLRQVDLSGQWPIVGGWHGVGRYNYSIKERRLVEGVAGLEYDGGCWVARVVLHRLATTADKSSTSFFVQLELNGLARIGSNPLDMLKRNVVGYGVINQSTADPVFGDN